jgi:hypothetical protein
MSFRDRFDVDRPLVGMVHLPPLPGAPGAEGDRGAVRERALSDARALVDGGVDGVVVENFGDAPFHADDVPKHGVADVTAVACAVVDAVDVPVGVNVLRNDAAAAVSAAAAAGADFVRVNVHVGARVTDQGLLEGRADETLRLRERVAADVDLLADVGVKHSAPLAAGYDFGAELADCVERGRADAVVVSGRATGAEADRDRLREAHRHVSGLDRDVPVVAGSGVRAGTVGETLRVADAAIVGTALKVDGATTNPVSTERVREVVAAADEVR